MPPHQATGLDMVSPVALSFEYRVPVAKGVGKPSCTDLMLLSADCAAAIEAKFTEPRYETVGDWLGPDPSANRIAVLEGWLDLVGSVANCALSVDDVRDLPYQLIHRAASACTLNRPRHLLAYLVFGTCPPHYAHDIAALRDLFGPSSRLSALCLECPLGRVPEFDNLERAWIAGDPGLVERIRAALSRGPLFQFGKLRLVGSA